MSRNQKVLDMNKTEIITEVSRMTSVSVADCEKVLDALEEVLEGELNRKGWKNGLFDMIFQIMSKIKSKKRVIGIYFFLFMLSVNVWGQKEGRVLTQSVRGRVIDAASGYPVAYVSVYLMGKTEIGGVTDSLGRFVIKNVPIGRHDIQASFVGYEPTIFREILVTSSKEVYLTIPLKESIKELDEVMVPKLTLQPLAENALYHGIKNKRGKGKILIEGFNLGDDMMLRVTDNGQGMTPERLYEVQEAIRIGERAGFGLAAVSERIALYYGPGYGLKISSTEGEGTVMEVYMAKKINLDNNSRTVLWPADRDLRRSAK